MACLVLNLKKIDRFGKLILFTELALRSRLRHIVYNRLDSFPPPPPPPLPTCHRSFDLYHQRSDKACLIFPTGSQLARID